MAEVLSRTCYYFGTFNPIHSGHLMIAQAALRQFGPKLGFGMVIFVPAGSPPHRHHEDDLLAAEKRLKMVRLATAEHPAFRVLDIETKRPDRSYTVDTLRTLIEQGLTQAPVPFIIGEDALANLATWHQPEVLVELAYFLQAPRPGCEPVKHVRLDARDVLLRTSAIEMPELAISSSWVRCVLRENPAGSEALRYFLPEPVRQFIVDNRLYQAKSL